MTEAGSRVDQAFDEGDDYGGEHGEESGELLILLFIIIALTSGTILHELHKYIKLPYTPMIFGLGILFGAVATGFGVIGDSTLEAVKIDPHGFLTIFLPALVFQSALNVEWHVFKREFWSVVLLAGTGSFDDCGILCSILKSYSAI